MVATSLLVGCASSSPPSTKPVSLEASSYIMGSIWSWSVDGSCAMQCAVSPVTAAASTGRSGAATLRPATCSSLFEAFAEEKLAGLAEAPPRTTNCADGGGPKITAKFADGSSHQVSPYGCDLPEPYASMDGAVEAALRECYGR